MPLTPEEVIAALKEATAAIKDATAAMQEERRLRRRQIIGIVLGMALLAAALGYSVKVARDRDDSVCDAVNQSRGDLTNVLAIIVESGRERREPEEQARADALFEQVVSEALSPVNC